MSKRKTQPINMPTPNGFPSAKNISDLIGLPLFLTKWEVVPGKDRDYYRISLVHAFTGKRYSVGTNAATVVEQLSYIPQEPEEPVRLTFAQLGKMYAMEECDETFSELTHEEGDEFGSPQDTAGDTLPDMQ